jgi:hypothetical protein
MTIVDRHRRPPRAWHRRWRRTCRQVTRARAAFRESPTVERRQALCGALLNRARVDAERVAS